MRQTIRVRASGWFNTELSETERDALLKGGILPVNDVFYPLWERLADIKILRGGRGGGKSEAVADYLIDECREQPYAKIYYGRKVFDTVRGSCFATIVASLHKRGIAHEFHFSEAESSNMVFRHKATGNKMIPFGSDKAEKLKSIKDPTNIWFEELSEFKQDDFKEIYATLRTVRGKNEFIGSFNAYSVFTDSWVVKTFFPEQYTGQDKPTFDALDGITSLKILANFSDNYFIDKDDYARKLKLACAGNLSLYEGLANGAWGIVENNNPWLYAFNRERHVRNLHFYPAFPVYISFDFNNNPFEATAWQFSPNKGSAGSFIHCIKEFTGYFKIEDMCQRIKAAFPSSILYITGDRSGQNEDIGRNQTLYQIIAGLLDVNHKLLNLNTTNLEHADSRLFLNAMMENYPDCFIDASCVNLIRQCEIATVDNKSNKPHHLLKDRDLYKLDAFDSMRYFFQTYFHQFAKDTYFKAINKR